MCCGYLIDTQQAVLNTCFRRLPLLSMMVEKSLLEGSSGFPVLTKGAGEIYDISSMEESRVANQLPFASNPNDDCQNLISRNSHLIIRIS